LGFWAKEVAGYESVLALGSVGHGAVGLGLLAFRLLLDLHPAQVTDVDQCAADPISKARRVLSQKMKGKKKKGVEED
jgi:hypothetical protein